MFSTYSQLLKRASKGHYAVGAFNVNNMEFIHAVIAAAEAETSPVIIQTSEGAISYAGLEELAMLVHVAAKRTRMPVVFHLDHGKDPAFVASVIKSGYYQSVMFDGSSLSYEDNVRETTKLVKLAHKANIAVEAELGAIAGIEDFVSVEDQDAHLTDPEQAQEFVKRTGCDSLAIAIGTSHGAYKFKEGSKLDFKRLQQIDAVVSVPLVLHGASGIPTNIKQICTKYGCNIEDAAGVSDTHIKKAVALGINKVNIDSDLRLAFDAGVRKFLAENPDVIDPRKILGPAQDLMTQVIRQKMRILGSAGNA